MNLSKSSLLIKIVRKISKNFSPKPLPQLHLSNANPSLETWPFLLYIATVVFCFSASSVFHLFSPLNKKIHTLLNRLDFGGIAVLIWGSSISVHYYILHCHQTFFFYFSLGLTLICGLVFAINLSDFFYQPKYRETRAWLFIIAGLSSSIGSFAYCFLR